MTDQPPEGTTPGPSDTPGTNWSDEAMAQPERRDEPGAGGGLVGDGATGEDAAPDERIDPDGMPGAAFDRRAMEAEGGDAERDDDLERPDRSNILQFPSRSS